jgi:hypothetical protein
LYCGFVVFVGGDCGGNGCSGSDYGGDSGGYGSVVYITLSARYGWTMPKPNNCPPKGSSLHQPIGVSATKVRQSLTL